MRQGPVPGPDMATEQWQSKTLWLCLAEAMRELWTSCTSTTQVRFSLPLLLVPAPQIWNPIWRLEGFVLVYPPFPPFFCRPKVSKNCVYLPFVTNTFGKFWWSGNSIVFRRVNHRFFSWKHMYVRHTGFSLVFRVGYLISYKIIMLNTTVICTTILLSIVPECKILASQNFLCVFESCWFFSTTLRRFGFESAWLKAVLRIRDSVVWIRIHGFLPMTNGSGSGILLFSQWPSRGQQKFKIFCSSLSDGMYHIYIIFQRLKVRQSVRSHETLGIKVFFIILAWR
jgi:hypothetical protein